MTDKPGNYGYLPGKYPAVVKSYDKVTRTCRVEIPGLTDNADSLMNAEVLFPVGYRADSAQQYPTEIEILPEDKVYVEFLGGDARNPLIVGARAGKTGNSVDFRRIHHANIELLATAIINIKGATVNIEGNVNITGGTLKHQGKDVGSTHKHGGVQTGGGQTSVPV
jgi:hypothetical protein